MKKILSIFFTAIFLITSVGFTYSVSFCPMSQVASVSLFSDHSCCCKSNMTTDCCKQEIRVIRITDNYSASSLFHFRSPGHEIVSFVDLATEVNHILSPLPASISTSQQHPPPTLSGNDRCILFSSFII